MARHPGRFRPTRPSGPRALVAALALTVVVAACGTSGRSMEEPAPGATAPPRKADVTSTVGDGALIPNGLFSMASPAFAPNSEIPAEYSCDGAGTSPPLTWGNAPADTVELVLLVTDPDADGFIHWMVTNIDPSSTGVEAGQVPLGGVQLTSSDNKAAYTPLCPPPGELHTYEFTLYALSSPSGLTPAADTRAASAQVASSASQTAVLTGTYARTTAN